MGLAERFCCVLLLTVFALASGCNRKPVAAASQSQAGSTNRQVFEGQGVVLEVKPKAASIEIRHQAIPGYMPAMTMPFDVKDTNLLTSLEPGDQVVFRLVVTDTEGWIDQIHKTNAPVPAPRTAQTATWRVARDVQPLEVGDPLPVYHLTNQLNQPFDTSQFKGQALAITFLFTRCPYPTFCPRMAMNFEQAQQELLARSSPTNWHLLTVTFDPDFDTPAVLSSYAEAHRHDPVHWSFATGSLIDITALGEQFGLTFWHDQTGILSHNLRTAVIDASGKVCKIFTGNDWTSQQLAEELRKAAAP